MTTKLIPVGDGWVNPDSIIAIAPIYRYANSGTDRYIHGTTVHFEGGTATTDEVPSEFIAQTAKALAVDTQEENR